MREPAVIQWPAKPRESHLLPFAHARSNVVSFILRTSKNEEWTYITKRQKGSNKKNKHQKTRRGEFLTMSIVHNLLFVLITARRKHSWTTSTYYIIHSSSSSLSLTKTIEKRNTQTTAEHFPFLSSLHHPPYVGPSVESTSLSNT